MQRKIIAQGSSSFTLTLPKSWIDSHNLTNGDYVSIDEKENELHIRANMNPQSYAITINLDEYEHISKKIVQYILTEIYRKGYDQIILTSSNEKSLTDITTIVRKKLQGFEIITQTKNKYIIENITEASEKKFDAIFRRLFFMLNEAITMVEKDDNQLQQLKDSFDGLTNYCRRMIAKYHIGAESQHHLYSHILCLSHSMHSLRSLSLLKRKTHPLLDKIKSQLVLLNELVHKQKKETFATIMNDAQKIEILIEKALDTNKDARYYAYMLRLSNEITLAASRAAGYLF